MSGEGTTRRENSRTNGEGTAGVQSVDRAVRVLEILARTGGAGVSEVAADLQVHKSTAFRLLAALEERGLVEQNSDRGKYQLGFGILRLASAIPVRLDLVHQARPVLDELAAQVRETVNLAVVRQHYAVNVAEAMGPAAISAQTWMGQLTPLHATSSGKILLAHLDDAQRDEILETSGLPQLTERTITSRAALQKQLVQARTDGYATTFEEYEVGLNAVAVPVRDHTGAVVAAVSASGPAFRLVPDRIEGLAGALRSAGSQISQRMGYIGS
ncbi:IclR family transcriptional regulator [Pedococcus sp. 5OH_020]|uniref:IclR family transcriptional regulator n=1 Tax=Pedococcus sp. 5OH_020 TaxID=2989814 RepID=UPI0022E9A5C3|nr:IclR family transcriptional regulator [Pedococcus sp. 5OH_020]